MLFFGLVQRAGASLLQLSLCNAEEESKDDCAVISRTEYGELDLLQGVLPNRYDNSRYKVMTIGNRR
jgi:hypothetical protein